MLGLQSCISLNPFSRRAPPPLPPPRPVLIEEINDEQFAKIDKDNDGKLDKSELHRATSHSDEWGAIKIFLILIGSIALICLAPLVPSLVKKVINKRKPSESEEK